MFAAQLLGREPPPEIPFAEAAATMSPMALSFWQDCRRVKNDKLKRELGVHCVSAIARATALQSNTPRNCEAATAFVV